MSAETKDVVDVLTHDHNEVKDLFKKIRFAQDTVERRDYADEVIAELVRHSVAEEQYLYPAAREYLPDGNELSDKELEDHAKAEELLKRLEGLDGDDPDFMPVFEEMSSEVLDHIREEEDVLFVKFREQVPTDKLVELGNKVTAAKKIAPTRPHPSAPDTPPLNKILDPGAGLVDRVRDKLSGRST